MKKILENFFYGIIFGIGSPIPGVSSGTVAILLNVYDSFFTSINISTAKKNMFSIVIFLLGWVAGLMGTSRLMMFLLEEHRQIVSFVFIGLVLGCVPMILRKATTKKIKKKNILFSVLAFLLMVFLAVYGAGYNQTIEELGGITPFIFAWLLFASFVSSIAMLVPGVGGSLIMLVFGIYAIYIEAVSTVNIVILIILLIGMVLGVLTGIFLTKKMLKLFSQTLYFIILGLIVGSVLILFPGFSLDLEGLVSVFFALLCFVFAFWLGKKETT